MKRLPKSTLVLGSIICGMAMLNQFGSPRPVLAASPATQPSPPVAQPPQTHGSGQSDRHSRRNRGGNTPTAAPTVTAGAQSIMDAIAPLKSRSIFIKGNQAVVNNDSAPSPRTYPTGSLAGRRESALVFNGVTVVDDEADALIEDTSSNKVSTVRPGDPIAGGKVSSITFDDLTYEVGGVAKHVAIGQSLDGETPSFSGNAAAPVATPAGSTPPASDAGTPAPPPAAPSGVAPPGASAEDILARMKAKRQKELAGQ